MQQLGLIVNIAAANTGFLTVKMYFNRMNTVLEWKWQIKGETDRYSTIHSMEIYATLNCLRFVAVNKL